MRNLKRALSLGLTAAVISGLMVMGSGAAGYADVTSEDNREAIEVLQAVGIMVGDENGNFNPDQNVTRNEMAVIMANLMEYNVATFKDTSPFTDVPDWAEPYVAACYTNKITSGYSSTYYGGSDTVTTAQAALMLMKALGYFQYEQDFGGDWQLATAAKGNDIDLFDGVDAGLREAMTRNDVAQLVLNTLEAGTVRASTSGSVTVGGVTIVNGVEYNFVTSTRPYAGAISKRQDTTNASDAKAYVVELGESLYQGELKKTESTDDFGRPASIWEYESSEVGTYPNASEAAWTTRVNERDLYQAAGSAAVNEYTWTVYEDGEEIASFDYEDGHDLMPSRSSGDRWNGSGDGILTEVFVDAQNDSVVVTKINTYLAEVTKVQEDEDGSTVTVSYKTQPSGSVGRTFDTNQTFSRGDIVLVTLAGEDGSAKEIQSMDLAETVEGTVTSIRNSDYLRMDGSLYNYNYGYTSNDRILGALYDLDDNAAGGKNPKSGDECTIYLDLYGNAIAVENAAVTADDYLYVSGVSESFGDVSAKVVFSDGTEEVIDIDEVNGGDAEEGSDYASDSHDVVPGHVYRFSKSGSDYDLTSAGSSFDAESLTQGGHDGKIENDSVAFFAGYENSGSIAKTYTADSGTVFVDADKNTAYIGYTQVPSMSGVQGWVVTDSGSSKAEIVFITNAPEYDLDDDSFFFIKDLEAEAEDNGDGLVYHWNVVSTGDEERLTASSDLSNAANDSNKLDEKGLYQIKSYDSDDYVTKVESVLDIPDTFDPAASSDYATTASNGVLVLNPSGSGNKLSSGNTSANSFSYNSETTFLVVEMDKSKGEIGDVYTLNSPSMIETHETRANADNSDRTAVYVVNADDKEASAPKATLVLVVVPDTAEEPNRPSVTSGVDLTFHQSAAVTIGNDIYTSSDNYDLPVGQNTAVKVEFGSSAKAAKLDVVKLNGQILPNDFNGTYYINFQAGDELTIGLETAALTLPANVTAAWTEDASEGISAGSADAGKATQVPVGAQVTVTVGNVEYYVEMDGAYKSNDSFDAFTMTGAKTVSDSKYHQVSFGTVNAGSVSTELGSVTIDGAIDGAPVFVKQGDSVTVTFTAGGSGDTTAAVYATMDSVTGLTSAEFASSAVIIGASASQLTVASDTVEIGASTATKDVTISYTLSNS